MNLSHRPFEPSDADIIRTFPKSAEELFFVFPDAVYPLEADRLLNAVGGTNEPTVAIFDGLLAGFAAFVEVREKKWCTIGKLMVGAAHRRKGVGAYLFEIMIKTAIDRYAARFVKASCFSHNKAAYRLLSRLGFRPADMAQRLGPDGDPVLLIHMHLPVRNWNGDLK